MKSIENFINKYKFHILSFIILFFMIFFVYHKCTDFDFIYLDDDVLILNKIEKMDSLSKAKNFLFLPVFESFENKFYRPVLNLSFFIDTIICAGEPGFYHYTNILIHIIVTFLVFLLFRSLNYSNYISLFISLFFAVHPALTSAIAWIPGRNDTLLALFSLLSFIFFIYSFKKKKSIYLFFSSFAFFLAILTKETALMLPIIYFLYIFLFYKEKTDKKYLLRSLIYLSIPILIYVFFRFITISSSSMQVNLIQLANNILISLKMILWYLGVLLFYEKIILYPQIDLYSFTFIKNALILLPLLLVIIFLRKKINFKSITFGIIWFIVFLLPTFIMPNNNFYTHRLYMPILGIFIIFAEIIIAFLKAYPFSKNIIAVLFSILILFMSFYSYKQSLFYKDRASFWVQAFKENPDSARVNAGLARYYESIKDYDKAEKYTLNSLNLAKNGDIPRILNQAGNFYFNKNDLVKSEEFYKKSIEFYKYGEGAYYGLSRIYKSQENPEAALNIIEEALLLMPQSKILQNRLNALKNNELELSTKISMSIKK